MDSSSLIEMFQRANDHPCDDIPDSLKRFAFQNDYISRKIIKEYKLTNLESFLVPKIPKFDINVIVDHYLNSIRNHDNNAFISMFGHHELVFMDEIALKTAQEMNSTYVIDMFSIVSNRPKSSDEPANSRIEKAYVQNNIDEIKYGRLFCDFELIHNILYRSILDNRLEIFDMLIKCKPYAIWKPDLIKFANERNISINQN